MLNIDLRVYDSGCAINHWITQMVLNTDEKKYGGQGLIPDDEDLQITSSKR